MAKKTLTTSIDEDLQKEFKEVCKERGDKMNEVLEACMRAYIEGRFTVDRRVKIKKK